MRKVLILAAVAIVIGTVLWSQPSEKHRRFVKLYNWDQPVLVSMDEKQVYYVRKPGSTGNEWIEKEITP